MTGTWGLFSLDFRLAKAARQRLAGCGLLWAVGLAPVLAADLPQRDWLEDLSLVAHSIRDQSVVVAFPDGERQLLKTGDRLPGPYDLTLIRVLDHRVEIAATRDGVSDRKVRLWFTPGADGVQVVTSLPEDPGVSPAPVPDRNTQLKPSGTPP